MKKGSVSGKGVANNTISSALFQRLEKAGIKISMDGKGRALDNVFVERLWRSVKYEEIYLNEYENGSEVYNGLRKYFKYYNENRPHQGLKYRTPMEVYFNKCSYCS